MELLEKLSKQEFRIAREVTLGYSEKEIAERLFISPKTVNTHTYNIRKKLNARCAVDIAREFILSLENPKQILISLIFLMIQFNIMAFTPDVDMRKPNKTTTRIVRTNKTARRYDY